MPTNPCPTCTPPAAFSALPFAGLQRFPGEPTLCLRNCPACGTTLARPATIEDVELAASTKPAPRVSRLLELLSARYSYVAQRLTVETATTYSVTRAA